MLQLILAATIALAASAHAAEMQISFSSMEPNQAPPGFTSKITGEGGLGTWKIMEVDAPTEFAPLSPLALSTSKRRVLVQLSKNPAQERFPFLMYDAETFGDFTLTTRVKCVSGRVDQMAGIAFRVQDENNYYVVRASALGNSFRFYKFLDGQRSPPIGGEVKIGTDEWVEISITCKANNITCRINGQELIPKMTDNSFLFGKIGFWTKSDSVSYFADTQITYTPRVQLVKRLVKRVIERRPSVTDVRILMKTGDPESFQVVASNNEKEIGGKPTIQETKVFVEDTVEYNRNGTRVTAMVPLHDRNGDVVAVASITSKRFFGESKNTTVFRGEKSAERMELQFSDASELLE
ncbi:MAG: hypothetical protein CMO80_23410 [Verrucomicrobiales bacterium]|nr:hypothetical protein [Verrucomicrobiales bacterium]|tara:strand:+ start:1182 stop:2234 length:1053 start_codon:yes stop_codon:yes gene_type:complete